VTGDGGLRVDFLTPAEWRTLRTLRLRALKESPDAFLSAYRREVAWSELDWRATFENGIWIVARQGGRAIGVARSVRDPDRLWERHAEAIWVEPGHRRTGVTRSLLRALADAERSAGVKDLLVWVLEAKRDARRVYERLGFQPTGEQHVLNDASGRMEERLRLRLTEHPSIC
jgi:GNAT superfamily N-acetyltransferase